MRKFDTKVQHLKYKVLREVARQAWNDTLTQNLPDIWEGRRVALEQLEEQPELWKNPVFVGSYDEQWSPKKVLRRFLWHDRIHAKAMFRRARAIWGDAIDDSFCFLRKAF